MENKSTCVRWECSSRLPYDFQTMHIRFYVLHLVVVEQKLTMRKLI